MSACVSIIPNNLKSNISAIDFAKFVTSLFAKRRKQLVTILGRNTILPEGIDEDARPATLSIEQLELLFQMS